MCGIAGILRDESKGPVTDAELAQMASSLAHRGPDGHGIRVLSAAHGASLGLAHTRLSIVDLSERASQPMTSNSGRTTIVFNGEIYNHRKLRERLEAMGARFRTTSDTEVILEGYEVWGLRVIHELEGMFAFALWDHREERLHLVRDRAGEKPLFVFEGGGALAFASEIKALRAVSALGIEPTPEPLLDYLVHGYVPPPGTFYRGVTQLLPGHHAVAVVSNGVVGRLVTERYWRPVFQRRRTVPSFEEAKREVRERMRAIVRDRFEADVPVGAFLSGGLDSAAVVGVATRDLGKNVHTYSIGFEDAAWDEAPDARLSAEHLGSTHEEFRVSQRDMPSIPLLVRHHDGPFSDSSAIPTYLVSKLARAKVTVALTGDGGDEVFGGYPRLLAGAMASYVPSVVRGLLGRVASSLPDTGPGMAALDRARRLGHAASLSLEDRAIAWGSLFRRDEALALFGGRDWSASLSKESSAYDRAVLDESMGQTPLARLLDHNFRTYLPDDLLVKVDRSAMAVSLETRAPFLDSGLVDFVGGLPDSYKQRGSTGKRLAREAFSDLFAPALLTRPKRGFGVPLDTWLEGPLRAELDDHLATESARIYQFLDRDAVYSDLYKKGHLDWNGAQRAFTLWTLEVWMREVGL